MRNLVFIFVLRERKFLENDLGNKVEDIFFSMIRDFM